MDRKERIFAALVGIVLFLAGLALAILKISVLSDIILAFSAIIACLITYNFISVKRKNKELKLVFNEVEEKKKKKQVEPPLPFATYASPNLYVETGPMKKLMAYISKYSGGNIAITGKRGSGKTSLLTMVLSKFSGDPKRCLTVYIPAPTKYEEKEFIINLYKTLLLRAQDALIERFDTKVAASLRRFLIEGSVTRRRQVRSAFLVLITGIAFILFAYLFPLGRLLPISGSQTSSMFTLFTTLYGLLFIALGVFQVTRPSEMDRFMTSLRMKAPQDSKIFLYASAQLERINYEQTYRSSMSLETGITSAIKGTLSYEKELTHRPYSLPELVDDYVAFAKLLTDKPNNSAQAPFDKVLIAIDELDKIVDPSQSFDMLRKMKAVLSAPGCYYLISVAEDATRDFNVRSLAGLRDEVESTFDVIIDVGPVTLNSMEEIILKRYSNRLNNKVVWLSCLTSAGIPREALRNIQNWSLDESLDLSSESCWDVIIEKLIKEKIMVMLDEVRQSCIPSTLKIGIAEVLSTKSTFKAGDLKFLSEGIRGKTADIQSNETIELCRLMDNCSAHFTFLEKVHRILDLDVESSQLEELYNLGINLNDPLR